MASSSPGSVRVTQMIFATILALVTSFFAYTSLCDPLRKVITRYELEYRGGVRLVFDVEVDPSLAAVQRLSG